jgi:hypothetical protein
MILLIGLSLGWGFAHKIWIEPGNAIIEQLKYESGRF